MFYYNPSDFCFHLCAGKSVCFAILSAHGDFFSLASAYIATRNPQQIPSGFLQSDAQCRYVQHATRALGEVFPSVFG